MDTSRFAAAGIALGLALTACASDKAQAPKPCCDQPDIPAGVARFKVLGDDVSGPTDGQRVLMRVGLLQPIKRDAIFPVLHTLYRYAMKRNPFEPIHFVADVYASEAAAQNGGESAVIASIKREQSQLAPRCDNRVAYDFTEQVDRAFAASLGQAQEENMDDTCKLNQPKKVERFDEKFAHKPTYKLDAARQVVEVTFPYLEMGKDEYAKELKLNSALTYWIEFVTSMFRKVPDLKEVTYVGLHDDAPALRITISRQQYDSSFSALQETIAAHAAITFQTLGMHRTTDKGAEKEQETFKAKTYKEALAVLPKGQVTIAKKLK
jgi:hypothetical protein